MGSLILKRANSSRLSGQWSDDDYDVLENGVVAGRILSPAPRDRPWMWASGHNGDIHRAAHRYQPTREGRGGAGPPPIAAVMCSAANVEKRHE